MALQPLEASAKAAAARLAAGSRSNADWHDLLEWLTVAHGLSIEEAVHLLVDLIDGHGAVPVARIVAKAIGCHVEGSDPVIFLTEHADAARYPVQ